MLRTEITSVTSLPSCHLTLRSSDCYPLPSPPPREGVCSRKSYLRSNNCHCERQNGASQSHNIYINNEITTSNASHSPRNDIENSCKTQVVDGTATSSHNNLQSSCNTQCGGWSGTLPLAMTSKVYATPNVLDGTATFPLSLCEREQLLTSLRVIRDAGEGFIGCQEVKLLSVLRTKITSVTSLPSCPLTFRSSDCYPLPQSLPQGREAEKYASRFTLHTSLKKQATFTRLP